MNDSMVIGRLPKRLTEFGLILFASTIPISHVPAQFGIGFAVLGWLLEGFLNKHWQIKWTPFFLPLILYVVWNIICSAASPRPVHSLLALVDNEWALFLMLMMYWTVRNSQTLRWILVGWFVSSSVAMGYAIWEGFYGVELYRNMVLPPMGQFYRSVGFYGFYLTFAAFAMTVFFISSAFALERGSKGKWYRFALPILSFAAVMLTFARSIWLSFAGVIPFLGFVRGKKKDRWGAVGLLGVFALGFLVVPTLRQRAESIFDVKANETRINLWETSLNISKDFRFVGIGEDNFDYYFEKYKAPGFYDTTVHPHNDYLNVLINAGVPGLIFFLWLWIVAIRSGLVTWRKSEDGVVKTVALGGTLSLVGLMIGAFFQDYYGSFINCLGWWFVVGLIFAGERIREGGVEGQSSDLDPPNQIKE
jgi:O-antigen ligase